TSRAACFAAKPTTPTAPTPSPPDGQHQTHRTPCRRQGPPLPYNPPLSLSLQFSGHQSACSPSPSLLPAQPPAPIPSRPSLVLPVRFTYEDHKHVAYDFVTVMVFEGGYPPELCATYHPTLELRPGTPITSKVRTYVTNAGYGQETWDFGDGSPRGTTK